MKSPDAFRTISEVAEELDLPQHVLRFWETRFSQIKPLKRGGGRRYYRPDDVLLLRGIRQLLYGEGYTIRGVQRILREQGVRYAVGLGGDAAAARASGTAASSSAEPPDDNGRVEPRLAAEPDDGAADENGAWGGDDPPWSEPAMTAANDAEDGVGPEDTADEPALVRPLPFAPLREVASAGSAAPAPASPTPAARALSTDAERRLRAALGELIECRRLLERQS